MALGPLLTDAQGAKIEPLLPPLPRRQDGRGRPWRDNRACLEGILWVLRTRAQWKALPKAYPSPSTCWRRLRWWEEQGVWRRIWRAFLAELEGQQRLQGSEAFIEGSFAPPWARPRGGKAQRGGWGQPARGALARS